MSVPQDEPECGYVIYGRIPGGAVELNRYEVQDFLPDVLDIEDSDLDGPDAVQVERVITGDTDIDFTVSLNRPLPAFRWKKRPEQWQASVRVPPSVFQKDWELIRRARRAERLAAEIEVKD